MRNVTFFIVDDDDLDVEAFNRAVKSLKIANPVVRAKDGLEALEMLRGSEAHERLEPPYIILLDINMPRMSGLELLEEIRSDELLHRSIVFMLTTSADERDILRAYDKNIAGYVVKSSVARTFDDALKLIDNYWRIVELPVK